MKSISIIIPSYNSFETICYTLEHIFSLSDFERVKEVIVVDSSDDKHSKEYLESYQGKGYKLITSGIRVMPAIQRNIGAKQATGDVLAFIDSDAYPDKNWISTILEATERGVLIGGGSYKLPDFQLNNKIAIAQYYLQFNEYLPVGVSNERSFFPSCNLFCNKQLFVSAGGFPEVRASEDTLFCLNAGKYARLEFQPQAMVYHIFRTDKKKFYRNQELLGRYVLVYRRQYYNSLMYKGIFPFLTAPLVFLIKLFRISQRVLKAGPEHRKLFLKSIINFKIGLIYWIKGYMFVGRKYVYLNP